MATAFNHMGLVTRHLEETLRFYQEGLGIPLWHVWGHENKDYILKLGDDSYVEVMAETHDAPLPKGCWERLNLRTENVREGLERALAHGGTLLEDVTFHGAVEALPNPKPYYSAVVRGVEGEEIGLIQEIGAEPSACRVHSVELAVTNLARSVKAYQNAFGLFASPVSEDGSACLLDLRGGVGLKLIERSFQAPLPRGVFAHIAFKDDRIQERYDWAASHGMTGTVPPMFCLVNEATPFPVQFWASGFAGPDHEDVTLIKDVII